MSTGQCWHCGGAHRSSDHEEITGESLPKPSPSEQKTEPPDSVPTPEPCGDMEVKEPTEFEPATLEDAVALLRATKRFMGIALIGERNARAQLQKELDWVFKQMGDAHKLHGLQADGLEEASRHPADTAAREAFVLRHTVEALGTLIEIGKDLSYFDDDLRWVAEQLREPTP